MTTKQLLLIFFLFSFFNNYGQLKKVMKIEITKIDYNIDFIKSIDCNSFGKDFLNSKTYLIKDKRKICQIQSVLKKGIFNENLSNNGYKIDTRGRFIFFYSDNSRDTMCVSIAALKLNNKIITDRKIINYIIRL